MCSPLRPVEDPCAGTRVATDTGVTEEAEELISESPVENLSPEDVLEVLCLSLSSFKDSSM